MKCTNYGDLYYAASFFPLTCGSFLQESQSVFFACDGRSNFTSHQSKSYSFVVFFVFICFGVIMKLILTFVRNFFFHLDMYLSGCALKQIWFEFNQNSNVSTNAHESPQYLSTMPVHSARFLSAFVLT